MGAAENRAVHTRWQDENRHAWPVRLVLGRDPGIIWGLADVRLPVVVAVTDDGLTVRGDVPPADISSDALFAYNVLGLGFCDGHTGCHAGDGCGNPSGATHVALYNGGPGLLRAMSGVEIILGEVVEIPVYVSTFRFGA